MNPGKLDVLVTISRATETRAANGSIVKTWTDIAQVWAAIEPVSGREAVMAQQLQTAVSLKATIRYGTGVTAKDRVVNGSIVYDITRVNDVGTRNSWQELWLAEAKT